MRILQKFFLKKKPVLPALKHIVVTTFHKEGYNIYGKKCIESFLEFWPKEVSMLVYAEDVDVEISHPRIRVFDHTATLPRLLQFRSKFGANEFANGTDPTRTKTNNFRWDAIRFSNKVFAVTDAIRKTVGIYDQLIWLDADTITHRNIPSSLLDRLAPKDEQLSAYLNRKGYPECGWVGYNLNHARIGDFASRFEDIYLSGQFLELRENHDSYVFWHIVKDMARRNEAQFKYLGSNRATGHIFINSELGGYLDHLKGDRKTEGKSRADDLKVSRNEDWWR